MCEFCIICRSKDQTVPHGELKASSSKSSNASNEAKYGGIPPSGSAGGGAPSGFGPSSSSSSSEASPFDPFAAAANEDSRRLQGMYVQECFNISTGSLILYTRQCGPQNLSKNATIVGCLVLFFERMKDVERFLDTYETSKGTFKKPNDFAVVV